MAATAVPVRSSRRGRRRQRSRVGDERLVARVRAGDHDAFETIYDRYYLGLLAFCRHMLGSRDEAEDALQQSFTSAYRALRDGTGVVDLRPWLYAIARNRCLSALRAQRDEVTVDDVDLSSPFDGLPAEIARRAELRELVEDLQRLPDDQRAALVLFELGDQCHGQIAEVLGVRREKVKALVFQAREALLRARRAREASCTDIREQLASLTGDVPRRGILRGHIERCPGCAAFELEVRSQRAAFSAILPVAPTVGLKASVLALLGGGGAAAAGGAGVSAGVSAGVGAGAGAAAVAGSVAAGGTTVGIAGLGGKTVVAKALAVVALAGGAGDAKVDKHHAAPKAGPAVTRYAPPQQAERPAVPKRATAARAAPTVVHHHSSKVAKGESVNPAPTSAPAVQSPTAPAVPKPAVQTPPPETATSPLQPAPPARSTPTATDSTTAPPPPAPTQTAPAPQTTPPPTTESAPATTSTTTTTATPSTTDPATTTTTVAPAATTDTTQSTTAPLTTSATDAGTSAPTAATP